MLTETLILDRPVSTSRMFSGLRSQCTMCSCCKKRNPTTSWQANRLSAKDTSERRPKITSICKRIPLCCCKAAAWTRVAKQTSRQLLRLTGDAVSNVFIRAVSVDLVISTQVFLASLLQATLASDERQQSKLSNGPKQPSLVVNRPHDW